MVGFATKNFIGNVGTFTIIIIVYIMGMVLYLVTFPCHRRSAFTRKFSAKLSNYLFWNNLIVAIFETILIIAFVGLIKVKHHMSFGSYGESIESWLTIIVMFGYICIPLIAFF